MTMCDKPATKGSCGCEVTLLSHMKLRCYRTWVMKMCDKPATTAGYGCDVTLLSDVQS